LDWWDSDVRNIPDDKDTTEHLTASPLFGVQLFDETFRAGKERLYDGVSF